MARKPGGEGAGQSVELAGELLPPALNARTLPLESVRDVRVALARCFRDARSGRIKTSDLTRYAFALKVLGDLVALETLEHRILALERTDHANHETRLAHLPH